MISVGYWTDEDEDRKEYLSEKFREALDIKEYQEVGYKELVKGFFNLENNIVAGKYKELDESTVNRSAMGYYAMGHSNAIKEKMAKEMSQIINKKNAMFRDQVKSKRFVKVRDRSYTKKDIPEFGIRVERYLKKGRPFEQYRDIKTGRFVSKSYKTKGE